MVNIDDCWMTHDRDENGRLYPDPERFPHGIKWLADYAHSKGVKLGIYNDYGTKTCGGYMGSEGYLQKDAQTFAEWEVDYLKMDGCYSQLLDQNDAYPAMTRFLNETGRKIVYSCSWPAYDMAMDYAPLPPNCNLWRNWDDIECNWRSIKSIIDKFISLFSKTWPRLVKRLTRLLLYFLINPSHHPSHPNTNFDTPSRPSTGS